MVSTSKILHSQLLESYAPHLTHGFTTRLDGVSPEPYKSLNLAFHVGDDPGHVIENRRILLHESGLSLEQMVCARQVHGDHVAPIGERDRGKGAADYESAIPDSDGLITREKNLVLTLFFADCVPILLFDPVKNVVGVVHAGWKGTVLQIVRRTVEKMVDLYGSRPEDVVAVIGPAIGGCCYQVSEEVAHQLERTTSTPAGLQQRENQWYADLKAINGKQLEEAGLQPEKIEIMAYCTSCQNHLFFSHRKEKGKTGRQGAFIALR